MLNATKKWLSLKLSSVIMVPFMMWFLLNFVSFYDSSYQNIVEFFSNPLYAITFSIFIAITFLHSALSISEIFEDYLHDEKIKNVANKLLFLFAIIMPLITILTIFNLKI